MKIIHTSDLHIGKQLYSYDLKEEQKEVLYKIIDKIKEYKPDVLIIAGDIYDRTVPSAEAYELFGDFLNHISELAELKATLIIAGNHDSAERLQYASSFMEKHKIYISTMPPQSKEEYLKKITLDDEYGPVNFYLLPFTKPGYVKHLFEEGEVKSFDDSVRKLLERETIDFTQRNVLLSHQFYISSGKNPERCDSEQSYITVGGLEQIETTAIDRFDYVALGHIHGSQKIGKEQICYSGSPLKYSVSEVNHKKGLNLVTLYEKGKEPAIEKVLLEQPREVRTFKGTLEEVLHRTREHSEICHDFVSITLTDEKEVYRPKDQLEEYFDHILEVRFENSGKKAIFSDEMDEDHILDPIDAFQKFFEEMNNREMNKEEVKILSEIMKEV